MAFRSNQKVGNLG